ncbi:MAG TPA: NAD(P)H-binding protein [Microlunatus sp.]
MIVVSAATGEFGRLVVECLLDRLPSSEVAVAVRDPAKAHGFAARGVEVRHGDYDDVESLRGSFEGADRLLFISSPVWDSPQRMVQHRHVIAAAREAKVGLLVYTSAGGADVSDQGGLADHHDTERAIIDSGVPSAMLRHPFYSEMFINGGLQVAVETGVLTSSTGGRGLNTATRADLAEAAAAILTSDGHANRGYTFTGPLWTYPQLAEVLSAVTGRTVVHRDTDVDEGMMAMIGPALRAGVLERQTADLEQVLGRPASSLRDTVAAALHDPSSDPMDGSRDPRGAADAVDSLEMTPGSRRS